MDDVKLLGLENRVAGLTFSEFGRRIVSNASGGTDHGAAQPMFVLLESKSRNGRCESYDRPCINCQFKSANAIRFQINIWLILQYWFCVPNTDIDSIMLKNFRNENHG